MPKKCTACVFYSRVRRRCIKLGVSISDPENPPCLTPPKTAPKVKEVSIPRVEEPIVSKKEEVKSEERVKPEEKPVKEVSVTKTKKLEEEGKKKEEVTKPPTPIKPPTAERKSDELAKVVNELLNAKKELEEYLVHYVKSRDILLNKQVVKIGSVQLSERDIALALKELEERKNYLYKRFMELDKKATELGAIRCPICNFPLPPNAEKCPYCEHPTSLRVKYS